MTLDELANHLQLTPKYMTDALEAIAHEIGEDAVKDLQNQYGTYQPGWPELSPATIADKAAQGYDIPSPLLRTGEMRDSLSYEVKTTLMNVTVIVSSDSDYLAYHETGTSKMPPRPSLSLIFDKNLDKYITWANRALVGAIVPGFAPLRNVR